MRPPMASLRRPQALAFLAAMILALEAPPHALGAESAPIIRIAFVVDATTPFAAEIRDRVRQELLALARRDFDIRFPRSSSSPFTARRRMPPWPLNGCPPTTASR